MNWDMGVSAIWDDKAMILFLEMAGMEKNPYSYEKCRDVLIEQRLSYLFTTI